MRTVIVRRSVRHLPRRVHRGRQGRINIKQELPVKKRRNNKKQKVAEEKEKEHVYIQEDTPSENVENVPLLVPPKEKEEDSDTQISELGVMTILGNQSSLRNVEIGEKIDWSTWISASDLKNFMLSDCFVDWYLYNSGSSLIKANPKYSKDVSKIVSANNAQSFTPMLMQHGNMFEEKVINLLKQQFKGKWVYIGNNPRSNKLWEDTKKAIYDGIPIIFQAPLRNYTNKTYGVADILIRSDWINSFLDVNALSYDESCIPAPNLKTANKNCDYHYVVIDIKYKTLPLRADGVHLRNDTNMKYYKTQLLIYTEALAEIQGYLPRYSFILGSKWKYESKGEKFEGKSCFSRLGRIDYGNLDDSYVDKLREGLQWLQDVKNNHYDLSTYPLPREELYPNLKNHMDFPYRTVKLKFAEEHDDIGLIWYAGNRERSNAHAQGVYAWTDVRCTPEIMDVKGKKRKEIIRKILEINQSETHSIQPKYIANNHGEWKNKEGRTIELYVDFETTCPVFNGMEDLPQNNACSKIFLIGAGYIHPVSKEWVYNRFVVNRISEEEEARICKEFFDYISFMKRKWKCTTLPCWHFSVAEVSAWRRFEKRVKKCYDVDWVDLLKVFMNEPVTVKGALNFSLKTIVKAMYKNGFISTHYGDDLECTNGSDAAASAFKANAECERNGTSFSEHHTTNEIIRYNEIDVKTMCDIMLYLRNNHISSLDDVESIDTESISEAPRRSKRGRRDDDSESI